MILKLLRRRRPRLRNVSGPAQRIVARDAFARVLITAIDMKQPHRAPPDVLPVPAFTDAVRIAYQYANEELCQVLEEYEKIMLAFHGGRSMLATVLAAEDRFKAACRAALIHER